MVRFVGAVGASVFGLLAVVITALKLGERAGVLGAFSRLVEGALIGNLPALVFLLFFGASLLALGALIYGIALNDEVVPRASWATIVTFAVAFLSLTMIGVDWVASTSWGQIFGEDWPYLIYVPVVICALVAALRDEEMPALDEISLAGAPRSAQEVDLNQPAHARTQPSKLPTYLLAAFAVLSVCVAAFLPVIVKTTYYSSSKGIVLFAYSPAFMVLMLVPLVAVLVAFLGERDDIQKWASAAGALLTIAMITLILHDFVDLSSDYTYGLFPVVSRHSRTPDALGMGFWLLAYSVLCWVGVFFDGFKFLGQMSTFRLEMAANSAPKPNRAPVDAGELAQRFVFSALTFIFCASCFPLGIFLWRYFDEQDNRLASAALAGWVVGLIFALLRLFLIFFLGASASDN